jgi:hypothetical protein
VKLYDQDKELASTDTEDYVHIALGRKPRVITLCGIDTRVLSPVAGPGSDALCPTCDVMRRAVA